MSTTIFYSIENGLVHVQTNYFKKETINVCPIKIMVDLFVLLMF